MSYSPTERQSRQEAPAHTVEVTMPQLGVSMAEGTVAVWHKRAGDWVEAEETVCEITTDKIDSEIPAPASGRVAEILVEADETVPVGTVLARIHTGVRAGEAHPDEQLAAPDAREPAVAAAPDGSAPADRPSDAAAPDASAPADRPSDLGRRDVPAPEHAEDRASHYHSPVVQRIAEREGVDLARVQGSGRGGRVRKQDVLAFIARRDAERSDGAADYARSGEPPLHTESPYREPQSAGAAATAKPQAPPGRVAPAPPGEGERLSRMRRSIAQHMVRSLRTAAHCTSIAEADFSAVQVAREALGLTYLPFVARATIDALRAHPQLNATLEGETLTRHREINLGIAVSLGDDGLVVPVIHDAQDLSHEGLARRITELARQARAGELSPDDVHGGTFTITNPGAFGTVASTPIINQPQVAILDLEAVVKRPVVFSDDAGQDAIAIRPMTYLCLSWDHRALDGAMAAQFLSTLRARIEGWGRT
ncbi:MAG TPA: dihydrolipoamide acetyltransferase family protein [Solirubrobacteraceae bacterium]|nr:dihydrolipoamide acetyltransferase family protein [Solirubrobacteraceae bacterium]